MELQPNIEPISNRVYQLVDDYSYIWKTNDIVNKLVIPQGFRYDGASVPRILWSISGIRPDGLHRAGSLIHDYIYHYEGDLPNGVMTWKYHGESNESYRDVYGRWSRKDTDKLSYKVWRDFKEPNAKTMYRMSRIFGYFYWKEF